MTDELFVTDDKKAFSGFSVENLNEIFQSLTEEYGLSMLQLVESASFSMAMVVRYALGLSATDGMVGALVSDSIGGAVSLATLRHLVTAGSNAHIIRIPGETDSTELLEHELRPLAKMNVPVNVWESEFSVESLNGIAQGCHNILCGTFGQEIQDSTLAHTIFEGLNDLSTPIHTVSLPYGINPESGKPSAPALFASSTISLGVPLKGLFHATDYVGRHYVCDMSIPAELYKRFGADLTSLFSSQPVVKISAMQEDEEELE